MKKNTGEIRFKIALERIAGLGQGHGFGSCVMHELAFYALTGKLSSKNLTWEPEKKDLEEIDYGIPKDKTS